MAEPVASSTSSSGNTAAATATTSSGGRPTSWRKISLPLPHLFPHLTINFHRSASVTRRTSSPSPIAPLQLQPQQATLPPHPPTRTGSKSSGRDWRLRRQKTYDSPGCLVAHSRSAISIQHHQVTIEMKFVLIQVIPLLLFSTKAFTQNRSMLSSLLYVCVYTARRSGVCCGVCLAKEIGFF